MKTKLNEFKSFLRKEIKAAITEVESKYADSFELDQAKGGTDTSMDKMQKELLKLQKEMNKLFVDYKAGRLDAKTYAMKRKPLQAKRNKIEADLLSIEESKVRQAVRGMIGKLFEAEKKEEKNTQEDNDLTTISDQVTSWYNSNKKKLEKLADEEDWDEFYEMGFNKFPDADQDDVAQAMNKAAMAQFEVQKHFNELYKIENDEERNDSVKTALEKITLLTMEILSQTIEFIETPGGIVDDKSFILDFLKNCDKEVYTQIRDYNSVLKEDTEIKPAELTCTNCGHQYKQSYAINPTDFFG